MNSSNIEKEIQIIDQLHNAVSQLSSFCFEIKKFFITTLFIVLTFATIFTQKKLDPSLFLITYIITLCFWFLDSTAYYYQVKLRIKMDERFNKVREFEVEKINENEQDTIENSRATHPLCKRLISSIINHSMWIYGILVILNTIALSLFKAGLI